MKYGEIFVKRNFLLNPATMEHEHIGLKVILDDFDNADECYLKARAKIKEWGESNLGFEMVADNKPLPTVGLDVPKTMTEVIENDALKAFWAEQMKKKLAK